MNTVEHRFHVPGISCGHCVATVVKALQPLGVQVAADTAGKQLSVEAPPSISREQLVKLLTEAGYPPSS
jgi:copper chaperone